MLLPQTMQRSCLSWHLRMWGDTCPTHKKSKCAQDQMHRKLLIAVNLDKNELCRHSPRVCPALPTTKPSRLIRKQSCPNCTYNIVEYAKFWSSERTGSLGTLGRLSSWRASPRNGNSNSSYHERDAIDSDSFRIFLWNSISEYSREINSKWGGIHESKQ